MKITFETVDAGGQPRRITLKGRCAWALSALVKSGKEGCTPITHPGPRWSAYVFKLRRQYGLAIETIPEPHKGAFPGTHARYVLRSQVHLLEPCGAPS